jgi:S-adenosylmethionine/arginine decarboxylase-like enzyme
MSRYWGYHCILDLGQCCPKSIRSAKTIKAFNTALVQGIDMVPYGAPQLQHFGTGNKAGYTLVQLIETSNICAHFVEETNDVYLDVFSCKPFTSSQVEEIAKAFFKPQTVTQRFLVRDAAGPQILA